MSVKKLTVKMYTTQNCPVMIFSAFVYHVLKFSQLWEEPRWNCFCFHRLMTTFTDETQNQSITQFELNHVSWAYQSVGQLKPLAGWDYLRIKSPPKTERRVYILFTQNFVSKINLITQVNEITNNVMHNYRGLCEVERVGVKMREIMNGREGAIPYSRLYRLIYKYLNHKSVNFRRSTNQNYEST